MKYAEGVEIDGPYSDWIITGVKGKYIYVACKTCGDIKRVSRKVLSPSMRFKYLGCSCSYTVARRHSCTQEEDCSWAEINKELGITNAKQLYESGMKKLWSILTSSPELMAAFKDYLHDR
jgi:hypothetical protein